MKAKKTWLASLSLFFLAVMAAHADIPEVKSLEWHGAKVLFIENHTLPIVDVGVVLPAGSGFAKTPGLAYLTLQMVGLATDGMNEEEVASRFDALGAIFAKKVDRDKAVFSLRVLKSHAPAALSHFTTVLTKPIFAEKALAREKGRMIAEIQQNTTLPAKIAERAFYARLYPNHPYGAPILGEEATVQTLTTQATQAFYLQHYCRNGAVITVVGDVSEQEIKVYAENVIKNLPDCKAPAMPPLPPNQKGQAIIPFDATQSHIMIGLPVLTHQDPNYYALLVGNYILGGGGFSSRMMHEVREKRGLAYHASTQILPLLQPGPFMAYLQTKRESTKEALDVTHHVLAGFLQEGPTTQELKAAKSNFKGGFYGQIDTNQKLLYYLNAMGFYHLPLDFLKNFPSKVDAVTAGEIQKAFADKIKIENLTEVIVGGMP
jgi:zinc protease